MCVSFAPADFNGTKIAVHSMELSGVGNIRVLMYQNTAQSKGGVANAMLLHIPTETHMGPENFIDLTNAPKVLDDMVRTFKPRTRGMDMYSLGAKSIGSAQVFQSGEYHIVLAENTDQIPEALEEVPIEKRPSVDPALLEFYQDRFGSTHKYVLACFNNANTVEPAPIGLWYVPSEATKEYLVFPALDCHTGGVPDIYKNVATDHWLFASDENMGGRGTRIQYSRNVPESVAKFLPRYALGEQHRELALNGDFRYKLQDVLGGVPSKAERYLPGVVDMN